MTGQPYAPNWRLALAAANAAPRCNARCRHSKAPCRGPAVKCRSVCRMHGGKGGGPMGRRNGRYRHGLNTKAALAHRREVRATIRELRRLLSLVEPEVRASFTGLLGVRVDF